MTLELPHGIHWHALAGADALQRLDATEDGLRSEDVLQRRKRFGLNLLPQKDPPGVLEILLHQFRSPLIYPTPRSAPTGGR